MLIPFPKGEYQIVYADPPWHFSSKQLCSYEGQRFHSLDSREYKTASKQWLRRLPVEGILQEDAACFMWSTDAHIPEAIELMKSWGFEYKTVAFVWEKVSRKGTTLCTLGAWTLKSYEVCLLGTRGRMLKHKKSNRVRQKVVAVRERHSSKPQIVRSHIEDMFGELSRIELFARQKTPGWEVWGDEV